MYDSTAISSCEIIISILQTMNFQTKDFFFLQRWKINIKINTTVPRIDKKINK